MNNSKTTTAGARTQLKTLTTIIVTAVLIQMSGSAPTPTPAQWWRHEATVVAVTIASPSQEILQKAQDYWAQGDMEAYEKFCALGAVTSLKKGTKVEVLDWSIDLVKVRPLGSIIEFWTLKGAIQKNY
jgi:hypothetical protein